MQKLFCLGLLLVFMQGILNFLLGGILSPETSILFFFPLSVYIFAFVLISKLSFKSIEREWRYAFFSFALVLVYATFMNRDLYVLGFIRAWFMPLILFLACKYQSVSDRNLQKCTNILFLFMIANFVVAYYERYTTTNFMIMADNIADEERGIIRDLFEFRANGLMGHPLGCGQLTSLFLSFILISNCKEKAKMYFCAAAFIAMMCFNTRFSLVMCAFSFGLFIIHNIKNSRKKTSYINMLIIMVALSAYVLLNTGLGGRIMNIGLYGNDDSSMARTDIFAIFNYIDLKTILFGDTDSMLQRIRMISGTDILIIENPFLVYMLSVGAILTTILFLFYYKLLHTFTTDWTLYEKCMIFIPWVCNVFSSISLAGGSTHISWLIVFCYLYNKNKTLFYNRNRV